MAESNLGVYLQEIISGGDEITVVKNLSDLPGGRSLNVKKYKESLEKYVAKKPDAGLMAAAYAGSPVGLEKASGEYVVLPLDENGAFTLPAEVEPVGVLARGIPFNDPRGAIVTRGQINWAAMPLKVPAAVRNALPLVEFLYVKE